MNIFTLSANIFFVTDLKRSKKWYEDVLDDDVE